MGDYTWVLVMTNGSYLVGVCGGAGVWMGLRVYGFPILFWFLGFGDWWVLGEGLGF